jgi:hypothetical protein
MASIHIHPPWLLPESQVTPENIHRNRRHFLRDLGLASAGVAMAPSLLGQTSTNASAAFYPEIAHRIKHVSLCQSPVRGPTTVAVVCWSVQRARVRVRRPPADT